MLAQNVHQGIVFPWDGMEQRYLSEPYWQQVSAALQIAKELGFTLNFADEFDWPSGHAWVPPDNNPELSRVLQLHPEYRMHRLEYDEQHVKGPAQWVRPPDATLAVAALENDSGTLAEDSLRIVRSSPWIVPKGKWLVSIYRLVPAVAPHNTRVDLLNPDAVKSYLHLVYGEYQRRFSQYFGNTLQLTVADHEGSYGVPIAYTPALWAAFQSRHGYDLRLKLPLLVHDAADTDSAKKVRSDYLDTISQLYVDAFSGQVAAWCKAHGLKHGTSIYEEQLYIQVANAGDMFRHWRAGSIVEIDALLERARMPIDFKEAVSIAHFDGKPLLVENQGLQGYSTYFSLEKARLGSNMALLWGANFLIPYFDYDQRKVTWPPQWFLGQPFWPYFHHYADYVQRVQFMNAQGRHIAPVLIYYPLETAFADSKTLFQREPHQDLFWNSDMDQTQNYYSALQLELARHHWDYHIVDSWYLQKATIQGQELHLGDEAFRVLILPPMSNVDPASKQKIAAFERAGGTVLRLGTQFPVKQHKPFMDRLDYTVQIQVPAAIQQELEPLFDALRRAEAPQVTILGNGDHLFLSHRQSAGINWYWFVNDSDQERQARVRFPTSGNFEKWDAETGDRTALASNGAELMLNFQPWDAYFVVKHEGPGTRKAPPHAPVRVAKIPDDGWRFTPEAKYIDVPYAIDPNGDHIWLAPERLSNRSWWLIGPFPFDDHKGFFTAYGPEQTFNADARYRGAFGDVSWNWYKSPDYIVTLRDALHLSNRNAMGVFYSYANVYSPSERTGQAVAAFADSLMAWCNGQKLLSIHRHPKWSLLRDPWAERVPIRLHRGWNAVLLKIGPSLMVPTAFSFRIVDRQGATMRDLIYSRDRVVNHSPEKVENLYVDIPPGTVASQSGHQKKEYLPPGPVPEHVIRFETTTVPFSLQSWTDSALAHYSGTAIYERSFTVPANLQRKRLLLDLGQVGVAAEVWVNGQKSGERVWRPFLFDITKQTHAGTNLLKIRVANSDAGWQSQGDTIYPRGSWGCTTRLNWTAYRQFVQTASKVQFSYSLCSDRKLNIRGVFRIVIDRIPGSVRIRLPFGEAAARYIQPDSVALG